MARKYWGRDEDKLFEKALVFTENDPNRFETIAFYLQKPLGDVKHYYDALVHDVELIESGRYGTIDYQDYADRISSQTTKDMEKNKKRAEPWTPEEQGLFLEGLAKYGKGDWKNIARMFVRTRTSTQVASHAQKYYLRLKADKDAKKRSSIHDITLVAEDVPAPRPDLEAVMDPAQFGQQMPQL